MTPEIRSLLTAVLKALDIPHPATVGDSKAHAEILADRALYAVSALRGVLHDGDDPGWSADYLRARLAEHPPTGYRHAGTPPRPSCASCRQPLDPTDTRHDGRARHRKTPFCRSCVDRCHESTDAFHKCPVCEPARPGGES